MDIYVCSQRHWQAEGMPQVEYEVLIDGLKFRCDQHALDLLEQGVCLDEIDLRAVEGRDDD
jgi:hypothetical protein